MPTRLTAAAVLLATAAGLASSARADIVDMYFSGAGQGQVVRIEIGERSISTFAGQLMYEITEVTDTPTDAGDGWDMLGSQAFFCTDLFQATSRDTLPYTLTGLTGVPDSAPMSLTTASAVESLFAFADQAQFAADAPDDLATAFQLALWEVVTDFDPGAGRSSLDIAAGEFRASNPLNEPLSGSVLAQIGTLFDAVGSGQSFGGEIMALRSPVAQDQLTAVMGVPATIPASGSLAAFGLGLLVAVGRRRR
ncbi:hypothetical protein JYT82_00085 [bacterium AH-315-K20]|nr:hypothetical protein [bacterium AH-315-K20]